MASIDLREAAQQALEALEMESNPTAVVEVAAGRWELKSDLAIAALRAALAEPEPPPEAQTEAEKMAYCAGWWDALEKARKAKPVQEPVAWRTFDGEGGYDYRTYEDNENYAAEWAQRNPRHVGWVEPLYTAPRVPLAEWQINDLMADIDPEDRDSWSFRQGVYAAEKHHGVRK